VTFWRKTWLLWLGIGAIVLGYVLLDSQRLSLGPLLLVGGYCLVLPFFLWRSFRGGGVGE